MQIELNQIAKSLDALLFLPSAVLGVTELEMDLLDVIAQHKTPLHVIDGLKVFDWMDACRIVQDQLKDGTIPMESNEYIRKFFDQHSLSKSIALTHPDYCIRRAAQIYYKTNVD